MPNLIDKSGQTFGYLTVIRRHNKNDSRNKPLLECKCKCGRIIVIRSQQLTHSPKGQKYCGSCSLNIFKLTSENDLQIITTKGEVILASLEDYTLLHNYTWHLDKQGYAVTYVKRKCVKMHRLIMQVIDPKMFVDHKNGIPCDNRRSNLRLCRPHQNAQNSKDRPKNDGLPRGVYKYPSGRFYAKVNNVHLGCANTLEEAIALRKQGEIKFQGEFSHANRIKQRTN